ncbi:Crp/Fnr family transcriptional regulator [Sulfitobacter guttiformis]|uniref:CRP/FNR family transcriptional regulator n=1 Tax=Sulfitobacter guttiformis TaxID=74349 RepID=A0A420DJH6_9RHOB|nr:Crp/Fnr family transcriptional regulator [Sulfitobacter guttiformis]KIN71815.1 Fnr-type transcriptional regulator [Sulfitobacter guttiformis KCTC 32187]RKE94369.1 CRP/FNR family transcriptional regulator [Sulfitobacter guttiformis]
MRRDIHNADVPTLCQACEARHRGICGALDPEQLVQLGRQAGRREVEPGAELIAAGMPADGYANILSGVVKLTSLLPDGRQQIVGLQFAPDFLGRPFAKSSEIGAEAASTVRLCTFPRSALEEMLRQSPGLEHRLYEQALRELDDARDWMMTLGQKTAAEKVASFLLLLGRHINPYANGFANSFDIPLRRADIADFLGLTVETVSRQLSHLRKAGIVTIEKNRCVTVSDLTALEIHAGVVPTDPQRTAARRNSGST